MKDKSQTTLSGTTSTPPLLTSLMEAVRIYVERMEQALKEIGLSTAMYETLSQLARADEPLTLRELAEGQHCVPSNITQKMDRLEKDGLVRRIADSEDRRISRAELTALGRKRTAEAIALMDRFNADFEQTLSPTDRAALGRVVASIT